jgi:hypothetical protein
LINSNYEYIKNIFENEHLFTDFSSSLVLKDINGLEIHRINEIIKDFPSLVDTILKNRDCLDKLIQYNPQFYENNIDIIISNIVDRDLQTEKKVKFVFQNLNTFLDRAIDTNGTNFNNDLRLKSIKFTIENIRFLNYENFCDEGSRLLIFKTVRRLYDECISKAEERNDIEFLHNIMGITITYFRKSKFVDFKEFLIEKVMSIYDILKSKLKDISEVEKLTGYTIESLKDHFDKNLY